MPVSPHRRVLQSTSLTGSIPDLTGLTALQWLYLFSNQLTGTIPSSLGNLNALTQLNIQNNQLTGSIPAGIFSLPNLSYLFVSSYHRIICSLLTTTH
ncbi:hypothetical protein BC831DRAFT_463448 [Entophlyctis helioformis]|nr:hypothetical protein BC831DRAFT_463448 [Entophlyctis helioformis]